MMNRISLVSDFPNIQLIPAIIFLFSSIEVGGMLCSLVITFHLVNHVYPVSLLLFD